MSNSANLSQRRRSVNRSSVVWGFFDADWAAVAGEIMFYPTGGRRPGVSEVDSQARHELTSFKKSDGVVPALWPGSHKGMISVFYKAKRPNKAAAPSSVEEETEANMAEAKIVWLIPSKYSELNPTTLTAEVEKGKAMEINFDSADFWHPLEPGLCRVG